MAKELKTLGTVTVALSAEEFAFIDRHKKERTREEYLADIIPRWIAHDIVCERQNIARREIAKRGSASGVEK